MFITKVYYLSPSLLFQVLLDRKFRSVTVGKRRKWGILNNTDAGIHAVLTSLSPSTVFFLLHTFCTWRISHQFLPFTLTPLSSCPTQPWIIIFSLSSLSSSVSHCCYSPFDSWNKQWELSFLAKDYHGRLVEASLCHQRAWIWILALLLTCDQLDTGTHGQA